ncbi:biopolymer transporter ExbD [Endozoicomonas sp. OPT23]|uniref:ExbD/TolR family protein n=1 Tax=Endozoicomonas sp. OPT23 TaxID=2072845 RepID=UPI00129AD9E9|nr:biopolymer transporter ExbD [Endozoicomonas sp. OPT23]MRI33087.1 biopolymer transporter ExbD [Endozoicomonas sp. OPT23]
MIRINSDEETSAAFPAADLTPLLDVVFIVMVFLLFTANVQTLSLPVNLPEASREEASLSQEPKTLTVSILAENQPWALEEQKFNDFESLSKALLLKVKEAPETTVLVAGDKEAPLGRLVELMAFFSKHKITAAQVLMEESTQ